MARKHTKCLTCGDVLSFNRDSQIGQLVVCPCRSTSLSETGPAGNWTTLTDQEKESLMDGILREDLLEMRAIFDARGIARPRHCFRWSATGSRWELSNVAAVNRTLIAYFDGVTWIEV